MTPKDAPTDAAPDAEARAAAALAETGESDWQITWRQFQKNPVGLAGLIVVYLLFAIAVFAPLLANGQPAYMRGVVTLFFDSDVTAFQDLARKVPERVRLLRDAADEKRVLAPSVVNRTFNDLQRESRQMNEVFERLAEYLPDEDLRQLQRYGMDTRRQLARGWKDMDLGALAVTTDAITEWLSAKSFALSYKRATNLVLDIEQDLIPVLKRSREDYQYGLEDEEPEEAERAAKAYVAARAKVETLRKRLTGVYGGMADFLTPRQGKALRALAVAAGEALGELPAKATEDSDPLSEPVDRFLAISREIDHKFSRAAIDPRRQKLPTRSFYPMLRYLTWGEVFFLAFYVLFTGVLIGVRNGGLPVSGRTVMLYALLPSIALALVWRVSVPPRNPPPDAYYKRFYQDLKARKARFEKLREAGEKDLPDAGALWFAPVPYGENENLSSDAKVPPTWAEGYRTKRRRLFRADELKDERTIFPVPASWPVVREDGPARRWRLPGRERPVELRIFPLDGEHYDGTLAANAGAFVQRINAAGKSADRRETARQRGRRLKNDPLGADRKVRHVKLNIGVAHVLEERIGLDGRIAVLVTWPKDQGPGDGPWGVELTGPQGSVAGYWPTLREVLKDVTSSMRREMERRLEEPGTVHWLGTDENGRDVLSRMIYGSRVSLSVGFIAVAIYVFLGIVIGALAGYFGGWADILISRFIEVVICFPSFFLIITVLAMFPPSIFMIMVVIGLTRWTGVARLIRGEFLRLVKLDFVVACEALGFSPLRIIFRHIVPNALAPVLVAATFGVAGAILTESALSYLGFGVPQPQASWGSILQEASSDPKQLWWITVFPGLAIFITITAYNIVGEAFRDASDPKLRK